MGKDPNSPQFVAFRQVLVVGVIIVLALFAMGYTRKLLTTNRLSRDRAALEAVIATEEARQTDLQKDIANLGSDADIERVARDELHLIKPGDLPIAVVPESQSGSENLLLTPTVTPTPTSWQMWLALLLH